MRTCCSASPPRASARAFRQLLKISGIGTRTALALLSGMTVEELYTAVASQDVARMIRIPGIGRKTAERLLLELRDQLAAGAAGIAGAGARLAARRRAQRAAGPGLQREGSLRGARQAACRPGHLRMPSGRRCGRCPRCYDSTHFAHAALRLPPDRGPQPARSVPPRRSAVGLRSAAEPTRAPGTQRTSTPSVQANSEPCTCAARS